MSIEYAVTDQASSDMFDLKLATHIQKRIIQALKQERLGENNFGEIIQALFALLVMAAAEIDFSDDDIDGFITQWGEQLKAAVRATKTMPRDGIMRFISMVSNAA